VVTVGLGKKDSGPPKGEPLRYAENSWDRLESGYPDIVPFEGHEDMFTNLACVSAGYKSKEIP
jgi:hypothetical protein